MAYPRLSMAAIAALIAAQAMAGDDFAGLYVGAKAGLNSSDTSGSYLTGNATAGIFGGEVGYNWNLDTFLVGVDGFYDSVGKKSRSAPLGTSVDYGSKATGGDLKLGIASDSWMPYAKLGWGHASGTGDGSGIGGSAFHAGLGAEFMLAPHWTLAGEWTSIRPSNNGLRFHSNSFTINLNYYFGGPTHAPVSAPSPAPTAAPEPMPAPPPAPPSPMPQQVCKDVAVTKTIAIDGANFATASAKLRPGAAGKLQPVLDAANQYSAAHFRIDGYTDSRGRRAYNDTLSANRAEAVKHFLIEHGVAATRISAAGHGPDNPVGDNATDVGRQQNRRVEVNFDTSVTKKECSPQ